MPVLTPDIPKVEIAIVEMTNAFRREQKLAAVKPNARLSAAARTYAVFLAQSNLFSHTADGRQVDERVKAAGYTPCLVAENLSLNMDSRGFPTVRLATDAVEGWKNSPGHRKNMLTPHVTEIGVAVAKAKNEEKYLSVQLFGRPQSLAYKFRIHNETRLTVHYLIGEEKYKLEPSYIMEHTVCLPDPVVFERAGDGRSVKPLAGRYEAREGTTYVLRTLKDGNVKVDVVPGAAPERQSGGTSGKR
ncbi:MAG: CAP domain-containing protein [Hyphomicrobiaceae bacterium]